MMNPDSCVPLKDHKERKNPFVEVVSGEKELWALVHSKGLLRTEVRDLYHKARSSYEKIILNDHNEVELQDIEYSLWKLHYKHIDEFRKRIRQTSASSDAHTEQFKSFLSEATDFYQDLITKLRRSYGLPEDPSIDEKGAVSCATDPKKLHKCQYSCHRFLVCLGDLARYRELCQKLDLHRHNWSVAASYYFKATLVWPDSGNPQNQLALLATYIGDDFLALYHCVRSLAIKEPFPDAWNNLMLLFEKNRSSHFHSLSDEAHFNFFNPSERITSPLESQSSNGSSEKSYLWPLFVRMISFFFLESSLDEFPCTFASTIREMDLLLALDDTKLKAALESYQTMDSARTGPYRTLQMVSVLIFIVDSFTKNLEQESKEKNPMLVQWGLTSTFICLGRLVERSLKGNPLNSPLLPSVLVFVECLAPMLAKVETYGAFENVRCAISYFVETFVELLNQLDDHEHEHEFKNQDHTALWEDCELRGFVPVCRAHESLDFTAPPKDNLDGTNGSRPSRIIHAAMEIVSRKDNSQEWILYDNSAKKFYTKKFTNWGEAEVAEPSSEPESKEACQHREGLAESTSDLEVRVPPQEKGKDRNGDNGRHALGNGQSVSVEEEEVILFKPITRYNSAPLYTSDADDEMSMEGKKDKTTPHDELLRRATSLFIEQSQSQTDPLSFRSNKPFKQPEPATYPVGPPSLSAWVLNRETSNIDKEKAARDFFKPGLRPIDEVASASLAGLFISETEGSVVDPGHVSAAIPYSAPVPSAPLLPDDAVWYTGKEPDGILGASPGSNYTNRSATHGQFGFSPSIPGFSDGFRPVVGLSSSEWLHQYANQNLGRASNQVWPVHFYTPGSLESYYGHEGSRFDLCDRWGNPLSSNRMVYLESPQLHPDPPPLVYGSDEQRREKLFHNYQRPSPYGCGAGTDLRAEQPQLLQYLKEKEWQLQRQSQVRGPAYMGN